MRVLYIHQYFSTPGGSVGTRSYEFSRHLVAHDHQVTVLTGTTPKSDLKPTRFLERRTIDGIEVILLDVGYASQMSYPRRMWAFARFMLAAAGAALTCGRPDVVFASSTPLTVGIPGILASWWHGAPFVFEVRDVWPKYAVAYGALRNPLLIRAAELLERTCYARAARIVAICETIAEDVAATGVDPGKIVTIPIGADIGAEVPWPERGAGPFRVVYAGAHGTANCLDLVLDAAAVLLARGADVEINLIGDGQHKAALQARAAREGLTNVRFHDPVAKGQIPEVLRGMDACLVVARDLTGGAIFPNKFFDYIAAGRPVIVNFPGELGRVIESEEIGLVTPAEDAEAFADAIARLAASPETCRAYGARARALATQRFDRRLLAGKLERLFAEVVGPKATMAPRRTSGADRRAG